MVVLAALVLVVAVFALIFRIIRRGPLRNWGLIALASLFLVIVFGGISNALYGGGASQQVSPPTETKEEAKQETPIEEAKREASIEKLDPPKEAKQKTPVEKAEREVSVEEADSSKKTPERAATRSSGSVEKVGEDGDARGGFDATVRVTRVVDGDTVDIDTAIDGITRVRLIGVDTPETKEPGCEAQPYGPEASKFTTSELQGKEVELEFDKDRIDPNDRLLAYVYKDDDEMFNETLLKEGYAQVAIFPPNNRYEDRFKQDQEEAKAAKRGIWGLSASELAKLKDRGNGFGSDRCDPKAPPSPSPPQQPPPSPTPTPTPSAPAPSSSGSYPPISKNSCPPNAPIKGNQQSGIYHVPGGQYYNATNPEECFASEADAQAAGYRKSKR